MVHLVVQPARRPFARSHTRTGRAQSAGRTRDFSIELLRARNAGNRTARGGICTGCRPPSEIANRRARPQGSNRATPVFDRSIAFPRSFSVIALNTSPIVAGIVGASFLPSAYMIELCPDLLHHKPE